MVHLIKVYKHDRGKTSFQSTLISHAHANTQTSFVMMRIKTSSSEKLKTLNQAMKQSSVETLQIPGWKM